MKKILCYGDSNTFGFNPKDGSRFDENSRWSGILKNNFFEEFDVIEQGLNNRAGFVDNPCGDEFCALKHFPEFFKNIDEVEIIVLAIGTNDLQFAFDIDELTIENGLKLLVRLIKEKNAKVILIPPVVLDERILNGYFSVQFNKESILKSKNISKIYKKIAQEFNCYYFDFNEFVIPSNFDGLHYDKNAHEIIAQKLTLFIKENNLA
ncbi:hypothetical protein IJ425_03525 [bacterium]|nr:hypothetical protein [bacterium]